VHHCPCAARARSRPFATTAPGGRRRDAEEGEETADLAAFQREYEDDHSWEALQEDEFGRLRALARPALPGAKPLCAWSKCMQSTR